MPKELGNIRIYSVQDISKALDVNERSIRKWLRAGLIKGRKIGTHWYVTEENIGLFLSGGKGGDDTGNNKKKKTKRTKTKKEDS
ncbi:MAG TPA: helix-turn-helix domain-containing protein [Syntrophorhabdaceae bacterium]|nr:helix-turn-helix domain-containing protein [Syntrophorhabdaceae bacterium]